MSAWAHAGNSADATTGQHRHAVRPRARRGARLLPRWREEQGRFSEGAGLGDAQLGELGLHIIDLLKQLLGGLRARNSYALTFTIPASPKEQPDGGER